MNTAAIATMAVQIVLSIALSVAPAAAQYTPMPHPLIQWFTNAGAVADGYGLCVFRAGTSTLATTYATSAGTANSNPIVMNAAGRATSGGVFLVPGESYKFVFKDATVTTCVPDTGVTIFTVDNVQAVPGSASAVDVTGTAGESLAAGDAVFLSNGTGGLSQGQWYKTDSDLTYRSTQAAMVGVATAAITAASSGAIRISGAVTLSGPLSIGAIYYAGATAGAIVTTPPTNAVRLGQAQSTTSLVLGYTKAPVSPRGPPCGRLTLTSATPVTTSDVTAATTVYYTPAGGCNTIFLYDGTAWSEYAFAEISIAVPATTNTNYDVFAYDNAGAVALELTAWTNDTTRATALAFQNGVYVKTGALTRRYLGTFRTTGVSGQTEDSFAKRFLWNYYNRAPRVMRRVESTDTWTYTAAAWRQANAAAANQLEFVLGVAGEAVETQVVGAAYHSAGGVYVSVGIGYDSTSATATGLIGMQFILDNIGFRQLWAALKHYPAVGFHYYAWLEYAAAAGTTTFAGDNGTTILQTGIHGVILG